VKDIPLRRLRVSAYSRTPSEIERDYYRALIQAFSQRRIELRLTQEQLDQHLGLSDGQVAKWEAFMRVPGAFMLMCWSQALGLSLQPIDQQGEEACQLEAHHLSLRPTAPELQFRLRSSLALRSLLQSVASPVGGEESSTPRVNMLTGSGAQARQKLSDTGS